MTFLQTETTPLKQSEKMRKRKERTKKLTWQIENTDSDEEE